MPPSACRTCPPHCGAPIGRGLPGVRSAGASGMALRFPHLSLGPGFVAFEAPRGGSSGLCLCLPPWRPRPPVAPDLSRLVPPQPQAALYSLGVVLKRFCLETPAGGRGAVRTAVSTAARGGQRAFTQPSFPAPGVPSTPIKHERKTLFSMKKNESLFSDSAFGNGHLSPEQKAAGWGLELQTWFFCLTLKH